MTSSPLGSVNFSHAHLRNVCGLSSGVALVFRTASQKRREDGERNDNRHVRVCMALLGEWNIRETRPTDTSRRRNGTDATARQSAAGVRASAPFAADMPAERPSRSEISHREHIGTMKPEHQEHLGRPAADPLDLVSASTTASSAMVVERMQVERAILQCARRGRACNESSESSCPTARRCSSGTAATSPASAAHLGRAHRTCPRSSPPPSWTAAGHERVHQRPERILVLRVGKTTGPVAAHQVAHHRIAARQRSCGPWCSRWT